MSSPPAHTVEEPPIRRSRIDTVLSGVENTLAAGTLGVAAALAIIGVIARNVTGDPIYWSEEVIIYMVIASTFFGAVITLRHNEHITIDLLNLALKERGRRILLLVGTGALIVFFAAMAGLSWVMVFEPSSFGTVTPALRIPLWVPMLPVPIGLTLLFIRATQVFVRAVKGQDPYPEAAKSLLETEGGHALADEDLQPPVHHNPEGKR